MRTVDLTFGWLLVVGSLLHGVGSVVGYRDMPVTLVWSLSGTLAGLLLASLNLLRARRPGDRGLAWVSFGGCLGWIAVALGFGAVSGNLFDVRALIHAVNAVVLASMSLRTAMAAQP
jgi:presenilin-like A22 family membrane protease